MSPKPDRIDFPTRMPCPGCLGTDLEVFLSIPRAPVFCNVLWPASDQALNAQCGPIDLAYCRECGLIYNLSFDETRVQYAPGYENSLFCSPHYTAYAQASAERLMDQYRLRQKTVVEIGCGSGQFLSLLCDLGASQAIGFDPSYALDSTDQQADNVTIVPERFSPDTQSIPNMNLVCCRHVLEHVTDPLRFLSDIHTTIDPDTVLHLEVPNGRFVLSDHGLWDIIYEHCSYFTCHSLTGLLIRAGFEILNVSETYDSQFLTAEAKPVTQPGSCTQTNIHQEIADLVHGVSDRSQILLKTWQQWLLDMADQQTKPVLWGAGSKGVMFLNLLGIDSQTIAHVVDINPKKHGHFIPGTGQEVLGPEALAHHDPLCVIIMNPVYQDEIRRTLYTLGCLSPVVSVWRPDHV